MKLVNSGSAELAASGASINTASSSQTHQHAKVVAKSKVIKKTSGYAAWNEKLSSFKITSSAALLLLSIKDHGHGLLHLGRDHELCEWEVNIWEHLNAAEKQLSADLQSPPLGTSQIRINVLLEFEE